MNIWEYLDRRAERRAHARKVSGHRTLLRLTFRDWLGVFLVTAFIAALFNLLKFDFPNKNEQLIVYMLGQLSGFVGAVVALHYTANRHEEQRANDQSKLVDAAAAALTDSASANALSGGKPTGKPGDPVHTTVEEEKPQ